jgi:RNA polymerase sigma factor (sigma-70 family)
MEISSASDAELLADWVEHQREGAFHSLVERYAGLVQMAAKRTCGDAALAADASQLVFILLAQKAKSLLAHTSLAGWLHVTAVRKARDLLDKNQRESRKRQRLLTHIEMDPLNHPAEPWKETQPVLDDALAALSDKDREALLLRFYRCLSVREIAATLGIATDAAQKRIDRATGRLRGKLARRGCRAGSSLAGAMLAGIAADSQAATLSISALTSNALSASAVGVTLTPALTALTALKSSTLIPPAIALAVSCTWLGIQYHSVSLVKKENAWVSSQIADARSTGALAALTPPASAATKKVAQAGESFDWKKLAEQFAQSEESGSLGDLRLMLRFEQHLASMTTGDLVSALDEIHALGLPAASRSKLETTMMKALVAKDPQLALTHFTDRLQEPNSSLTWSLATALRDWATKDPGQATAWFDREIAAGTFDSKSLNAGSQTRTQFEGSLISALLSIDPEAAGRRLAAIPSVDRADILRMSLNTPFQDSEQVAMAKLIRDQLPVDSQPSLLAEFAVHLSNADGYSKITDYLDRIDATPAERQACIERAASAKIQMISFNRKVSSADFDQVREWAATQAPDRVDQVTGKALAGLLIQSNTKATMSEITALASHYDEANGNQEVLASFLECRPSFQFMDEVRTLVATITDENRREEILKKLNLPPSNP